MSEEKKQVEVRYASADRSERALSSIIAAAFSQGAPPANEKEFEGLQRVARESIALNKSHLETIIGFVRVILENRLPAEVQESISMDKMCVTIGTTMCNDPVARERLIKLQHQVLG
jgi:hypothetical protein